MLVNIISGTWLYKDINMFFLNTESKTAKKKNEK